MHALYGNRVVRDALSGDSSGVGGVVASEMTRSAAGVGGGEKSSRGGKKKRCHFSPPSHRSECNGRRHGRRELGQR